VAFQKSAFPLVLSVFVSSSSYFHSSLRPSHPFLFFGISHRFSSPRKKLRSNLPRKLSCPTLLLSYIVSFFPSPLDSLFEFQNLLLGQSKRIGIPPAYLPVLTLFPLCCRNLMLFPIGAPIEKLSPLHRRDAHMFFVSSSRHGRLYSYRPLSPQCFLPIVRAVRMFNGTPA